MYFIFWSFCFDFFFLLGFNNYIFIEMAPLFDSEGLTAFHEMAILTLIWVGVGGGITTPRPVGFPLITQKR